MTLVTSSKRGTTPMNESSVLAGSGQGDIFSKSPTPKSAKMTESLFIIEYDGSLPLRIPADWPFPEYEVRRKLPMKECSVCMSERFYDTGRHNPRNRRTSWVFRKKGGFFWLRVCFEHMKPGMRMVIKEMYSR